MTIEAKLQPFIDQGVSLIRDHCDSVAEFHWVERCAKGQWDDEGEERLGWRDVDFLADWLCELQNGEVLLNGQEISDIKFYVWDHFEDWRDCFAGDGW